MMSSPPSQQQPLSFSQYTNMLSSSPLKPSNFYFNADGSTDNGHNTITHTNNGLYNDENTKPVEFFYPGSDMSNQYQLTMESDENLVVPASQINNLPKQGQFLQYPPRLDQCHQYQHNQDQLQSQQHLQHLIQQHQQHEQSHQTQEHPQVNLYPPMEFMPTQTAFSIKTSTSTNTISSFDSMPLLGMSTSVSEESMASPMSYNTTVTPRRTNNRRLSSAGLSTPLPQIYQTPSQNSLSFQSQHILPTTSPMAFKGTSISVTPNTNTRRTLHRRTRSKLSLDASGAASVITLPHSKSTSSIRSPAQSGTNPFYTPQASFLSPRHGSPAATPLATPSLKRESNLSSISPVMLMNPGNMNKDTSSASRDSIYLAAADLTMRLASKVSENKSGKSNFICDPIVQPSSPSKRSLKRESSGIIIEQNEDEEKEDEGDLTDVDARRVSESGITTPKSILSRSQSSVNLSSIIAPPEIKVYDILKPRKRMQKSQSTTNLETADNKTKKPKKMHHCPICDAAFQRPEHVKRHMRSHSSEKPFACEEVDCGKRFNRPDNLKAHLRKIHHRTDI